MGPARYLAFFLVASVMATLAGATPLVLSEADQRCFFKSVPAETTTPLRSCRTCLNDVRADAPCFVSAQGLCLSTDNYNYSYVAPNVTYCPARDPVCTACLKADPTRIICEGIEGNCICLAACESATWEADARAAVSTPAPTIVADAPKSRASHTSLAVVVTTILACVVLVGLSVAAIRRRFRQKPAPASPVFKYNMVLTPTAGLPAKTLAGRA